MGFLEELLIDFLLLFTSQESLYNTLGDPRTVAIMVGAMVAVSGALLGTFLVLRKMAMTSDAISHTVLLGIVVSFLVLTRGLNQPPDLNSIWLIIGAAASGVVTVFVTELIFQSGLVKEDAALGLAFPFLFAIAVIIISQYVQNTHLDADAVLIGEIGLTFGNANEYCYENCTPVTITAEHPRAKEGFRCVNCVNNTEGPRNCRDSGAQCEAYCFNCGTYTASEAYAEKFSTAKPKVVLWPKALTEMGLITLLNILFVTVFYKELKIATFDAALASTLGFHPKTIHYLLMALVSITAVGAFDAVGAVLVVAFFVVPPATAYLLTDRLWLMLVLSAGIGALGAALGYDLSKGTFFGIHDAVDSILVLLDETIGIGGYTDWNTSPGASMVMMMGFFFVVTWIISPKYGLISNMVRRVIQRRQFAELMILAHLANHQNTAEADTECRLSTLPHHLNWTQRRVKSVVQRLRLGQLVKIEDQDLLVLTPRGSQRVTRFQALRHH